MKKCKFKIMLCTVFFSTMPLANVITSEDIEQLNISSPADWQTYNTHQLFDGISDRYSATRFAAYQKSGDSLSSDNPYNISLMLTSTVSVNSLGFFNDWRYHLDQQVSAMSVSLYNENRGLLWSNQFNNLQQNSWQEIKLFDFSNAIDNVSQIDFNVIGLQGNHFEIRELLVGYTRLPTLQVSSENVSVPSIAALILLGISALLFRRQNRLKTKREDL